MRCKAGMLGANREIPWDLSTASYKQSFSVNAQSGVPTGLAFKPDGTKLYFSTWIGGLGEGVYEYDVASPWDVSTATFLQKKARQDARAVVFKPDGTRMFLATSSDFVEEFSLSVAWDISTATFVRSLDVSVQSPGLSSVHFKPDGTQLYLADNVGDDIHEYSLSAAWNISTASYVQSFTVAAQDPQPQGIAFKPDGKVMYVCGSSNSRIYQYALATAWDVSTATYIQNAKTFDFSSNSIAFKPDGTKFYIAGNGTNAILEHEIT